MNARAERVQVSESPDGVLGHAQGNDRKQKEAAEKGARVPLTSPPAPPRNPR